MKKSKITALVAVAAMSMALVACGEKIPETPDVDTPVVEQPAGDEIVDDESAVDPSTETEVDSTEGEEVVEPEIEVYEMSEEMKHIHNAAIGGVGVVNYWANMQTDKAMFEEMVGLTSDMYTDFLYEMPMISANVDSLMVVKPAEGQEQAVLDKVTEFRQMKVDDTFQYPQNIAKTKGSVVKVIGDYVVYVQLGAEAGLVGDDEAAALTACEDANKAALDSIESYIIDGIIPEEPVFEDEFVEETDDVVIDETVEGNAEVEGDAE